MEKSGRDLSRAKFFHQIHRSIEFLSQCCRLLEGVESSQTIARTRSTIPIFADGEYHGIGTAVLVVAGGTDAHGQTIHPVCGLEVIGGADDGHIEHFALVHGLNRRLQRRFRHGKVLFGCDIDTNALWQ